MFAARFHLSSFHSNELLQALSYEKVDIPLKILCNNIIVPINNYKTLNQKSPSIILMMPQQTLNFCFSFFLYNIKMGASQQRACEIWITIQGASKNGLGQLFDLSRQKVIVSSSKAYFPSYLHFYQLTKTVTYSLLQDRQNQIASFNLEGMHNKQISFKKAKEEVDGKIWRLLRDDEEVQIQQGDLIKFGRIQLQLKEFLITNNKKSVKSILVQFQPDTVACAQVFSHLNQSFGNSRYLQNSDIMSRFSQSRMKDSDIISMVPSDCNLKKSIFTEKSANEQICRFCFDATSHKSNPLFNVCQCAGSVKLIHYLCLKNWIKNKMGKVETSHCIFYHFEPLICELCKQNISNEIRHQGRVYSLFQPQKIHPPYARFQYFQQNKVFQILVRLEQSSIIQIGRGPQNELNINESSLNRSHASLFYTNRQLFLQSKPSKHGTYVQLSKSVQLTSQNPIKLLIKNHLITIDRKPDEKGLLDQQCCSSQNFVNFTVK